LLLLLLLLLLLPVGKTLGAAEALHARLVGARQPATEPPKRLPVSSPRRQLSLLLRLALPRQAGL